ncbi:glycosyltransferase [Enterovibrio norvegicus]|uniref:glycosyltransferase n=1 Tax=Enterovibrio norvegicus TaxID=188144 RepID=UPI00352CD7D1
MELNKRRIAVLLAAYNGDKYIKDQIESILLQKECEVHIFISVDVSEDSTVKIISHYEALHFNITQLPYGNKYGSAGANFFRLLLDVDYSDYDYIAFADQDDIWLPEKLERAINMLESNGCDGYSSNVTAFWPDGREKLIKKDYPQKKYDYLFESPGPGCTFLMTNKLAMHLSKYLHRNKEGVSKLWLHDWLCYAYARSNNFSWYIDTRSLMLYRQHENNEVGANSGFGSLLRRIKSITKGDAKNKVIVQAEFLEINSAPIRMFRDKKYFSLVPLLFDCRRSTKDCFLFLVVMIFLHISMTVGLIKRYLGRIS